MSIKHLTGVFLWLIMLAPTLQAQMAPPVRRQLPPSLEAELRRSQIKTAAPVIYRDTARGAAKISALARSEGLESDSISIQDSAIAVIDSAVSIPQKEWIDSQIVETPELARFGNKVHFDYPQQMLVETQRRTVPFDSTILARMNPVTRENLPFFDQSPLPLPLSYHGPSEGHIDAGGGLGYAPRIDAMTSLTLGDRTAIDFAGDFLSRPSTSAVTQLWKLYAVATAELAPNAPKQPFRSTELRINTGFSGKKTALYSGLPDDSSNHSLSVLQANMAFRGSAADAFRYRISGYVRSFSDNYSTNLDESSYGLHLNGIANLGFSHFQLEGSIDYDGASSEGSLATASEQLSTTTPTLNGSAIKLLFGQKDNEQIEWLIGAEFLRGSDITGSHTTIDPVIRAKWTLNPRWELGGTLEPGVTLANHYELATINPFYNPLLAHQQMLLDNNLSALTTNLVDPRRATLDNFNVRFFTNYILSADDNLHAEIAFINRDREVIFNELALADGRSVFVTQPESTRRITASFSGNFLVAAKDVATVGFDFSSAIIDSLNTEVPFEPIARFDANYAFNSFWESVKPSVQFRYIARRDKSLSFLNFACRFELSRQLSILATAENILGGPGDFWTSYNETPRAVWATLRYIW